MHYRSNVRAFVPLHFTNVSYLTYFGALAYASSDAQALFIINQQRLTKIIKDHTRQSHQQNTIKHDNSNSSSVPGKIWKLPNRPRQANQP
jgi:hypothetical protein